MNSTEMATPVSVSMPMASAVPRGLTFNGFVLFVIGFALAGSGFRALRIEVGGLMVHPYLVIVAAVFPLLFVSRCSHLPRRIVLSLLVFSGLYFVSTFSEGVWLGEGLKIAAAVITILAATMLVRNRADFVAGVLGLSMAIAFLAFKGLESNQGISRGVITMDVANRNAYSLYALPVILVGGYFLLRARQYSMALKIVIAGCLFASVLVIFLSLNRSGWIGILVISLMLFKNHRIKGILFTAAATAGVSLLVAWFYGTDQIETRLINTWQGLESDRLRLSLTLNSLAIGMENPLFGVSPQELPRVLARRFGYMGGEINSHNVVAHVLGGSGLFCLCALFAVGWTLWHWRLPPGHPASIKAFIEARTLLRMFLLLWIIRGMFTHEILYSPGFCTCLGMCIGLCICCARPEGGCRSFDDAENRANTILAGRRSRGRPTRTKLKV